ncbi:MAG TPA: proliferating cell nuclear antigen (pcna) [Nitrososphaerales archaeon]|nr:proliferating cell nuclear antigen (pcna) [Nitrososphaerales archaeon]
MPEESSTSKSAPATFVAMTQTPSEWKAVTAAIQALVEEATFEVSNDGISFRAMDPSHVALVDLFWPSSEFQRFECSRADKFTVRVEDFAKLIRRAESKDSLEVSRQGSDSLIVKLVNGYKREFELHLIESSQSSTPLPKLNFDTKFTTSEPAFDRILNDVSAISNHITIEALHDRVQFSGKGDTGKATVSLEKKPTEGSTSGKAGGDLQQLSTEKESKSTYSIEYLLKITKAAGSASDIINFEYSSKMPLRLEFKLGQNSHGRIHFYLAPRVTE